MFNSLRRLLMPPEEKRSRAGALVALHSAGHAAWTPRNYTSLAREGFAGNAVGYRCVRMIAEAAASLPWLIYEGEAERDDHPLLRLLRRPNPAQSGRDLMESLYGFIETAGNGYVEAVAIDGEIHELHALRPDRMRAVPSSQGWPEAYEYSVNGSSLRYRQDGKVPPILHLKLFNPLDDHYGLSPFEAAQKAIDTHNAAGTWNKAMLDNGARPSGALMFKGVDGAEGLTPEQYERLKIELDENHQGALRAGRPLVLEGGLEWKEMSLSPREMDFIEAKNSAARDVALAFGVPPMLLGIPGDNTFANYAEANRSFWRMTVIPLALRVAEAMGNWLAPGFEGEPRLGFDFDQVEALSPEREALWSRVGAAEFLTLDEKRAAVGYGVLGK